MASLEADMAHMRTVVQAASSESAYLSSISASQSSMMSKISASQSSMTARAASSAQAAQSSASSAAAEASRVMVSLSSESVSRQAEATKQPVHGQMFTCDDSESTSDYGACCERYLILMEGENVMLAPQDCEFLSSSNILAILLTRISVGKKAATANNQTAYRCTTDNPFGLCCVETDSKMKQCGSAKTMFKLEDFSKASEQAPTNMSWTLQKELQGSMGRFMQGGI